MKNKNCGKSELPPMFPAITVELDLDGPGGNAFAIMGKIKSALSDAGVSIEDQASYQEESMSEDYENLLATARKWVCIV